MKIDIQMIFIVRRQRQLIIFQNFENATSDCIFNTNIMKIYSHSKSNNIKDQHLNYKSRPKITQYRHIGYMFISIQIILSHKGSWPRFKSSLDNYMKLLQVLLINSIVILSISTSTYSLTQTVSSTCQFTMSYDGIWLAQGCANQTNMYKFVGGIFVLLNYTIPINGSSKISIHSGECFLGQASGVSINIYKFNDTAATLINTITPDGINNVNLEMSSFGNTLWLGYYSTGIFHFSFYKYGGSMYAIYGNSDVFTNVYSFNVLMSPTGDTQAFWIFFNPSNYVQFTYKDTGTKFSMDKYFSITQSALSISYDGVYLAFGVNISNIFYMNITYSNGSVYSSYNSGYIYESTTQNIIFSSSGGSNIIYLIINDTQISIFSDKGSGFTIDQTIPFQGDFSAFSTSFGMNITNVFRTQAISNNNYVYVYCNIDLCKSCSDVNICDECLEGNSLESGVCKSCNISYCKTCSSVNNCTSCQNGTTLYANACVSCNISRCTLCTSTDICSSCQTGFTLSSNSCIVSNISHCNNFDTPINCTSCISGYHLSNNSCLPCTDTNCKICNSSLLCTQCQANYTLQLSGNCSLSFSNNSTDQQSSLNLPTVIGLVVGLTSTAAIAIFVVVKIKSASAAVLPDPTLPNVSQFKITEFQQINEVNRTTDEIKRPQKLKKQKNSKPKNQEKSAESKGQKSTVKKVSK